MAFKPPDEETLGVLDGVHQTKKMLSLLVTNTHACLRKESCSKRVECWYGVVPNWRCRSIHAVVVMNRTCQLWRSDIYGGQQCSSTHFCIHYVAENVELKIHLTLRTPNNVVSQSATLNMCPTSAVLNPTTHHSLSHGQIHRMLAQLLHPAACQATAAASRHIGSVLPLPSIHRCTGILRLGGVGSVVHIDGISLRESSCRRVGWGAPTIGCRVEVSVREGCSPSSRT
jgi:hypothetical protein